MSEISGRSLRLRRDPGARVSGRCRVPSDKSITQRGILLGAVASGTTVLRDPLDSADARSVLEVVRRLGVEVERAEGRWTLHSAGAAAIDRSPGELDFGNSGTGARLGLGLLAGLGVEARVTGDSSLCSRPMGRVVEPLLRMGAAFRGGSSDRLPLDLEDRRPLRPFVGETSVPSAQVKSAILLAALHAEGTTELREPVLTRDHTERMLPAFGVELDRDAEGSVILRGPAALRGAEIRIPADPSSAASLAAAAALVPGSQLRLERVLCNPRRSAFFDVLAELGARVEWRDRGSVGAEDVADLWIEAGPLRGIEIPPERVPDMIDELPLVAVLGALAEGRTVVRGAAELRVKESDRIAAVCEGMSALGACIEPREDGFVIEGRRELSGGCVRAHADHRIAMAMAVAALRCRDGATILGADCVEVSYPRFFLDLAECLGGGLRLS